jgi:hypothetical protein
MQMVLYFEGLFTVRPAESTGLSHDSQWLFLRQSGYVSTVGLFQGMEGKLFELVQLLCTNLPGQIDG